MKSIMSKFSDRATYELSPEPMVLKIKNPGIKPKKLEKKQFDFFIPNKIGIKFCNPNGTPKPPINLQIKK